MGRIREIDLSDTMSTLEERRAFRDAHSGVHVHWVDSKEFGRETSLPDAWQVAHYRTRRWRLADSQTLGDIDNWDDGLDLRGVRMSDERQRRLRPVLASVTNLRMDQTTPAAQAANLVDEC